MSRMYLPIFLKQDLVECDGLHIFRLSWLPCLAYSSAALQAATSSCYCRGGLRGFYPLMVLKDKINKRIEKIVLSYA